MRTDEAGSGAETSADDLTMVAWRKTCNLVSGGSLGMVAGVLERHGALRCLASAGTAVPVAALAAETGLHPAYAHLAAQIVAMQGFATVADLATPRATISLTEAGRAWSRHASVYEGYPRQLEAARQLRAALRGEAIPPDLAAIDADLCARLTSAPSELAIRVRRHVLGPLVAVAMRELAGRRSFARIAAAPFGWCPLDLLPFPRAALEACVSLLSDCGWLIRDDDLVRLTREGMYAVRWSALHGYVVGYLDVLAQIPALLGGDGLPVPDPTMVKSNADREMLLAGKAQVFSRGGLRDPMETMVADVFDQEDLAAQPRILLDMNAGEASVLVALHDRIVASTLRGRALAEHPLRFVGLVSNPVAHELAAARLQRTGVDGLLLRVSFEDPDGVARELALAGLDLRDALVVSKTCIHGRGLERGSAQGSGVSPTTGAVCVTPAGELVSPARLEDDLAGFFARWGAWVGRHGMIAADAHTVSAEVAARSWPVNVMTHVCATHGFSAQYMIEAEVFRRAARRAGLTSRATRDLGSELIGAPTITLDHFVAA